MRNHGMGPRIKSEGDGGKIANNAHTKMAKDGYLVVSSPKLTTRALFAIYESRKVLKCLLLRTIYLKTSYHFSDCALDERHYHKLRSSRPPTHGHFQRSAKGPAAEGDVNFIKTQVF